MSTIFDVVLLLGGALALLSILAQEIRYRRARRRADVRLVEIERQVRQMAEEDFTMRSNQGVN